jgi:hypothetical protein
VETVEYVGEGAGEVGDVVAGLVNVLLGEGMGAAEGGQLFEGASPFGDTRSRRYAVASRYGPDPYRDLLYWPGAEDQPRLMYGLGGPDPTASKTGGSPLHAQRRTPRGLASTF